MKKNLINKQCKMCKVHKQFPHADRQSFTDCCQAERVMTVSSSWVCSHLMRPPLIGTSPLLIREPLDWWAMSYRSRARTGKGEGGSGWRYRLGKHSKKKKTRPLSQGNGATAEQHHPMQNKVGGQALGGHKKKNLIVAKKSKCPLELRTNWDWGQESDAGAGDAMINWNRTQRGESGGVPLQR